MQRCVQCIIPDTVPGIRFDEQGVCEGCRNFVAPVTKGEEEFANLLTLARQRNSRYDCVVPVSGGRDSCYVLYLAKAVYGLKVLAVNFDNEFRHPYAAANVERACAVLGVDLRVVRSRHGLGRRIVQHSIASSLPVGLFSVLGRMCRACTYGYRSAAFRAAIEFDVPIILWGSSNVEETKGTKQKAFEGQRYSGYEKLLSPSFYKVEWLALRMRREFPVPGNPILNRQSPVLTNSRVRQVSLFDYIPWDRRKVKETIVRELGWEKPPEAVSTWRTDCLLPHLINYCFISLVGCTKSCFGWCNMIRAGQMERIEALAQEEALLRRYDEGIDELLTGQIGLTRKQAEKLKRLGDEARARWEKK